MSDIPGLSARQIHDEVERQRKARDLELPRTRERAASWAKGIGALLATGLAFSLIKGRSDLSELDWVWRVSVGVVLLVAIGLALISVYFLFRAAYGRLEPVPPATTDHTLAVQTMGDLRIGLRFAVGGTSALLIAVGITWYGPGDDGPELHAVDGAGTSWCGTPIRTSAGTMTMKVDGQEVLLDLTKVRQLNPVVTCPKT